MLPLLDGNPRASAVSTEPKPAPAPPPTPPPTQPVSPCTGPADTRRGRAVQVLAPGASRYEWLRARRDSIGGSEAAAVAGVNRFCSPYELWLVKTGRHPGPVENDKMRAGVLLEPVVVELFERQTGLSCTPAGMWRTPLMPWQHANPDRWTSDGHGLEAKTTFGFPGAQEWDGGPTGHAICQSQWYMHVTGRDRWYIALLTDGWQLTWWWMERDQVLIDILAEDVARFWHEHVVADTPPPVDGGENTRLAIRRAYGYAYATGSGVEIPGLGELVAERRALKASITELKAQLDGVENTIKAGIGDHEFGAENGRPLIQWRARNTNDDLRYLKEL